MDKKIITILRSKIVFISTYGISFITVNKLAKILDTYGLILDARQKLEHTLQTFKVQCQL